MTAALSSILPTIQAEQVKVRQQQGSMQGFLVIKDDAGKIIAIGTQSASIQKGLVHSKLSFRFADGSVDEETSVFRQDRVFQLVRDHHVQRGPSFPDPLDLSINTVEQQVTWCETKDGQQKTQTKQMDLPNDLVNGMTSAVIESLPPGVQQVKMSYLAGGAKPRVVELNIQRDGKDPIQVAGQKRNATRMKIHVDLGGVAGVVAPMVGKQPTDTYVWVMDGEVRSFIRMQGALYLKGPIWKVELTSPTWPKGNDR